MTPRAHLAPLHRPAATRTDSLSLDLRCFSYEERRHALPALLEGVSRCGGWVLERQTLPNGHVEFWFEAPLRTAMDVYSGIIGAGLEMSRAGHRDIATLCQLRQNLTRSAIAGRLVTLRLEISFVDEDETSYPVMASRAALA